MMPLWAGTGESYDALMARIAAFSPRIDAHMQARALRADSCDDEDPFEGFEPAESIQVVGNVGIITIFGQLMEEETWWSRALQIPTYEGIRARVSEAAEMADVTKMVTYIDSPGGLVSGMHSCRNFLADIDKKIKPIVTVTPATLCSAAYCLASGTRRIYADEGAEVGSIGILGIHTEYTKMLEAAGVTKEVLRSAEFKALGQPCEKFSDKARAEMQGRIDMHHKKFVEAVANGRRLTADYVGKTIANGKVFDEQTALSIKMIDGVQSLEKVVGSLIVPAPTPGTNGITRVGNASASKTTESNMAKKGIGRKPVTLPAAALAALALGDPTALAAATAAEAAAGNEGGEEEVTTDAEAAAGTGGEEEIQTDEGAQGAATTATNPPAVEAAPAPVVAVAGAQDAVVALLREQLTAAHAAQLSAQTQAATLTAERDQARASVETANATITAMETPIREYIQRMAIGLSSNVMGLDSLHGATLVAQYTELSNQFNKRFKVGQQTRADATPEKSNGSNNGNVTPIQRRQTAATGFK